MFESLPDAVSVYEVSPRDGLQNEAGIVPTPRKARLIEALAAAGLTRIEATSFVSPHWIPQLADAEALVPLLPKGPRYSALCPNARGLARALKAKVPEIGVFLSASETHNRRNINDNIDNTLARYRDVVAEARAAGLHVRAYLSTVWGCPYEGAVELARAVRIGRTMLEFGCYELSLGDTIGVGTPRQTETIVRAFADVVGAERLALHMHDTRGTALANVLAGLGHGVRTFDASVGGLGGCPYAPGAAGNLASEDLVYMLHGMGVTTDVDLDRLCEAGRVAAAVVGHELSGKVHRAGVRSLSR